MRHERIISQNGFISILRKFHRLNKENAKNSIDEIVIEITDKEVLEKIEVPEFIVKLAEKNKLSLQDMITTILKCFTIEYVKGSDFLTSDFIKYLNSINLKG